MDDTKIEIRKLSELKKYPQNPRGIDQERALDLQRKIQRYGQLGALLIDGRDKTTILGGNHAYDAMVALHMTEAKVEYRTPKDDAEALELCILHNERYAHWIEKDLAAMLKEYQDKIDLSDYVISLGAGTDLLKVLARYGETEDDEFNATVPETPISEYGKVYQLGRHRLMCGDSTKIEDVAKLMGGAVAQAIVTDPPYGVSYEGNPNGSETEMIKNDDLRGDDLQRFLEVAFENGAQVSIPNCPIYVFYASSNHIAFEHALALAGFTMKQQLIWAKHMVIGNSDYHWAHEPIMYAFKGKEKPPFYGDRTNVTVIQTAPYKDLEKLSKEDLLKFILTVKEQSTMINVNQDWAKYDHPTQKPVKVMSPLIKNSTPAQGAVLDLFAGSGTTLIAAHQLDRVAYCMELSPGFCDVIRRRYAKTVKEEERWEQITPEISLTSTAKVI